MLLYPRVMYFDIAGGGGIGVCSSLFLSFDVWSAFSEVLFLFLLRLPFEGVL